MAVVWARAFRVVFGLPQWAPPVFLELPSDACGCGWPSSHLRPICRLLVTYLQALYGRNDCARQVVVTLRGHGIAPNVPTRVHPIPRTDGRSYCRSSGTGFGPRRLLSSLDCFAPLLCAPIGAPPATTWSDVLCCARWPRRPCSSLKARGGKTGTSAVLQPGLLARPAHPNGSLRR